MNNTGVSGSTGSRSRSSRSSSLPGINEIKNTSLNFSIDPERKLKLYGTYDLTENTSKLFQSSFRTTYLPNDSLLLLSHSQNSMARTLNHALKLKGAYDFSDRLKIISDLRLRYQDAENNSSNYDSTYYNDLDSIAFRRQVFSQRNSTKPSGSFSNTLQKRFRKKGRVLSLRLQADYHQEPTLISTRNLNEYFEPSPNISDLLFDRSEISTKSNTTFRIQLVEPISERSKLSVKYTNTYTSENNARDVWKDVDLTRQFDSVQSRAYESKNMENTFGALYYYSAGNIIAHAGLDLQHYNRRNSLLDEAGTDIKQSNYNYFPRISVQYGLSEQSRINFGYSGSVTVPDIRLLQPIIDYTDSLNIFTGNPHLKPVKDNNVTLSYRFMKRDERIFWVAFRSNWQKRQIINKTEQSATRISTTPVNADGAYSYHLNFHYGQQVIPRRLKGSLGMAANYSRKISITNGVLQPTLNSMYRPEFRVSSTIHRIFDGHIAYRFVHSNISTGNALTDRSTYMHTFSTTGTLSLPLNFSLGYLVDFSLNKGIASTFENRFLLVNITVDKTFTKPKGLTVRLQAFDLFNGYPTVYRTFSENYYEDRSVNRLGNFYMCSLIYRFLRPLGDNK